MGYEPDNKLLVIIKFNNIVILSYVRTPSGGTLILDYFRLLSKYSQLDEAAPVPELFVEIKRRVDEQRRKKEHSINLHPTILLASS